MEAQIKALFLDVGGVLLTNGWGGDLRKKTAEHFGVEYLPMDERHRLIFDTYETGKLSFDDYLNRIIFYKKRDFTIEEVKRFIFNAVRPFQETIDWVKQIKKEFGLKLGVVSNEGRELAVDRIRRFQMADYIDFFIVSSFVHFRKPDPDIYRLAIDVAQVPPSQILYIDDRELLVEVAKKLGVQGLHHEDLDKTKAACSILFNTLKVRG